MALRNEGGLAYTLKLLAQRFLLVDLLELLEHRVSVTGKHRLDQRSLRRKSAGQQRLGAEWARAVIGHAPRG